MRPGGCGSKMCGHHAYYTRYQILELCSVCTCQEISTRGRTLCPISAGSPQLCTRPRDHQLLLSANQKGVEVIVAGALPGSSWKVRHGAASLLLLPAICPAHWQSVNSRISCHILCHQLDLVDYMGLTSLPLVFIGACSHLFSTPWMPTGLGLRSGLLLGLGAKGVLAACCLVVRDVLP